MDPVETAKAHIAPQKSRKRLFIIIGVSVFLVICIGIIVAAQVSTTNQSASNRSANGAAEESEAAPAVQDTRDSAKAVDTSSTQLDTSLTNAEDALKDETDYEKVGE